MPQQLKLFSFKINVNILMQMYKYTHITMFIRTFMFNILCKGVDGRFVDVEKVIGAMESTGGAMSKIQSFLYICTCQGGRDIPKPPLSEYTKISYN